MEKGEQMKRWQRSLLLGSMMSSLCLMSFFVPPQGPLGVKLMPSAHAQSSERRAIASSVYTQLTDFPLENHYVHTETGKVDPTNTLIYRLLQYHTNVQSRPVLSRFDWKLTLADYLGVNEWMDEERYPDRFLQSNPFHRDVEVVQTLNRQQRDTLIQELLSTIESL